MSTIVAVKKNSQIAIAADVQCSSGNTTVPGHMRIGPRKIHAVGTAYIGVVGTMSHQNVLASLVNANPDVFQLEDVHSIFETLRRIHPILKEEYFLQTDEDDRDQEYESSQMSGLVINRQGVFSFYSYREVAEYDTFWAAGSGRDFALGAAEALYERESEARTIAELSVRAACIFDDATGPPIESYDIRT